MTLSHRLQRPAAARAAASAPTLRPVHATDAAAMQAFLAGLGAVSRRFRFHGAVNACAPALLRHLTQVDGRQHVAFVACVADSGNESIVGEARYVRTGCDGSAEFAIAVAESHQGQGLADALLRLLDRHAAAAGVRHLQGDVLHGNLRMTGFMRRHGFEIDLLAEGEPGVARWERATTRRAGAARAALLGAILSSSQTGVSTWIARFAVKSLTLLA